jgi:hypothetical protein
MLWHILKLAIPRYLSLCLPNCQPLDNVSNHEVFLGEALLARWVCTQEENNQNCRKVLTTTVVRLPSTHLSDHEFFATTTRISKHQVRSKHWKPSDLNGRYGSQSSCVAVCVLFRNRPRLRAFGGLGGGFR